MENKTQRIIELTTSEDVYLRRYHTYQIEIDETKVDSFIENIQGKEGQYLIDDELRAYKFQLIQKIDGKEYPCHMGNNTEIEDIKILN